MSLGSLEGEATLIVYTLSRKLKHALNNTQVE